MANPETRRTANTVRTALIGLPGLRIDNIHHTHSNSYFIIEDSTGHYTVTVEKRT